MVVPEREKGVKSFRIPRAFFRGGIFFAIGIFLLVIILGYDYVKILGHLYENKHLTIENRQLREQIQLNLMKINTLTDDLERIRIFERKLRVITGLDANQSESIETEKIGPSDLVPEEIDLQKIEKENKSEINEGQSSYFQPLLKMILGEAYASINQKKSFEESIEDVSDLKETINNGLRDLWPRFAEIKRHLKEAQDEELMEKSESYQKLKTLYEKKMAMQFGLATGYSLTKEWSELTRQSFELSKSFAQFDHQFNNIKKFIKTLEVDVHKLDQYLLDKESFLKSTPTLLPTKGWITSYYGPRQSHYSNRIKMHEGIDIGAQNGTPIMAPADGVVTYSGHKPGFGLFIQLDHGYGIETAFAHSQSLSAKKGQTITRGQVIARVGSTGYSTAPHVHYEVRVNGTPVDPLYYILD